MSFVAIQFIARTGDPAVERCVSHALLSQFRLELEQAGEMDTQDRFSLKPAEAGPNAKPWTPVAREAEAQTDIGEGLTVKVQGLRRAIELVDAGGERHTLFVSDKDTLETVRNAHPALAKPELRFRVKDAMVETAEEGRTGLRGVSSLALTPPPVPAEPEPFRVLLMPASGAPALVEWPDGSMDRSLADLRAFLAAKAPAAGFLAAADSQPIPREMEAHETLEALGPPPAPGKPLRVKCGSLLSAMRKSGLGGSDVSSPGSRGPAEADEAGPSTGRLTLRQPRDLLNMLGDAGSVGGPQHWFDDLDRETQERLLRSFRHLHGLRFVPVGHEPGDKGLPAYGLDRSVKPALEPVGDLPAVQVVLPAVTTRYSAFASSTSTADSVRSMLSWDVGGSVQAEAKQGAVQLKSRYEESTTRQSDNASARLIVKVEYVVARGEIVVDPDAVRIAPHIVDEVRKLMQDKDPERKRHGIAAILQRHGAYVPMRTQFGGKLIYRQVQELDSHEELEQTKKKLTSSLEAKVKQATVEIDGGFTREDKRQLAKEFAEQRIDVTMVGGDPALGMLPYRWADSLDHFPWWAVIGFHEVVPLLGLLPAEERRWIATAVSTDSNIAKLLPGPLDWNLYVSQILDLAAQPAEAQPDDATSAIDM